MPVNRLPSVCILRGSVLETFEYYQECFVALAEAPAVHPSLQTRFDSWKMQLSQLRPFNQAEAVALLIFSAEDALLKATLERPLSAEEHALVTAVRYILPTSGLDLLPKYARLCGLSKL